jgi:hypothetical protein
VNTFHYSGGTKGFNNNADIGAGLMGMMNPNLDARMPVLLGIFVSGTTTGHAVVADGYGYDSGTPYHHLNLGWSGNSTAWYALPIIDTTQRTYNVVSSCVYNVYTNGSSGEIISGRVIDQNAVPIPNATVTATRTTGGFYTATTDAHGIYAFTMLPSGSQYNLVATKANYNTASGSYSTGTSADNSATSGNFWGANFTLSSLPTAVDHFVWGPIGVQGAGVPFGVTISAFNTTNGPATGFNGTVAFSATGVTAVSNVIVGNLPSQQSSSYSYSYTDGYSFTPNTNIQVVAVRSYYGTKVSIWTDSGTLLASQNVPNQPGTWVETSLATPITLLAGITYRVGVYYTAGTTQYLTYWQGDWPTNFSNGTVGQNFYMGSGNAFPNFVSGTGLGPFLDLRYTVQSMASLPVSPAFSGTFSNRTWSGSVSVLQVASNVVLKADDGAGHIGLSGAFNVRAFAPVRFSSAHKTAGGQFQFTVTGGNGFEILSSTNLQNWTSVATLTNSTGTTNYTEPATNLTRRFFRAREL